MIFTGFLCSFNATIYTPQRYALLWLHLSDHSSEIRSAYDLLSRWLLEFKVQEVDLNIRDTVDWDIRNLYLDNSPSNASRLFLPCDASGNETMYVSYLLARRQ